MLVLLALMGCSDPKPVAIAACQALPGLAVDEAGRALLADVLIPEELEILDKVEPTRGLEVVGSERLAELRSKTTCVAGDAQSAGAGRWAVPLTRTSPVVNPDGTFGEPVETTFDWQVADVGDLKVDTGLKKADSMRRSLGKAVEEADWKRVSASWRTLGRAYPDPLIAVDTAEAEAHQAKMDALAKLQTAFESADDDTVTGSVTNPTDAAIAEVTTHAVFSTEGDPIKVEAKGGPLEAGGTLTLQYTIPAGASGNVKIVAVDLKN